jgi:hypothetical protein
MGKHKDGSGIICIICRGAGHLLDGWCKTCGGDGHIEKPRPRSRSEVTSERAGKSKTTPTTTNTPANIPPAKPTAKHYLPRSERYSTPPLAHQRTI